MEIYGKNFTSIDQPFKGELVKNIKYIRTHNGLAEVNDKDSVKEYLNRILPEIKSKMITKEGFISIVSDLLDSEKDPELNLDSYTLESFLRKYALIPGLSHSPKSNFRYDMTAKEIYDAYQNRFLTKEQIKFR